MLPDRASLRLPGEKRYTSRVRNTAATNRFYSIDGHPDGADAFEKALSLLEGVRKCTLIPAEILAASTPAMRGKGRLQAGADADIVVFDFEALTDQAEFSAMNRPSKGVRHLLVSGQPLINDGVMDVTARPGRPGAAAGRAASPPAPPPGAFPLRRGDPADSKHALEWRRQ